MEEKESTPSGWPENAEIDVPTPLGASGVVAPQGSCMGVEKNFGVPASGGSGGGGSFGGGGGAGDLLMTAKKKRGRPRKYDIDGNLLLTYPGSALPTPGFTQSGAYTDISSHKRGRGRPRGSGNWQLLASLGELFANTAGGDFTPHVVTVQTGEDVAARILSFSHKGPRGICILSANGSISGVTIRQPGSSGGFLTYEGRFEILSLTGSFTVSNTDGIRSRTGGLSVSLAGPDGRVIGGGVAGLLTAASPIQIVVGSFKQNGYKAYKKRHHRDLTASDPTVTAARPISQAIPGITESRPPVASPIPWRDHEEEDDSRGSKQNLNEASSYATQWNGMDLPSDQRPSPDINLSADDD
ncbi:hypothetical protein Nepgr_025018 [Nepenthes gracilis]|uniref:AT-hook motif nuclear-localized protein n=1 Tax=Nepenthes gracilis TaxID=150966 RepID=A0AAD3Y0N2_NEPGR|nr:hypothetical protein Nepgr_025018 [Nepenthes gracilis]